MAKCRARAFGYDANRCKGSSRLGSQSATGKADTWRTFSSTTINADGSGSFEVKRDGKVLKSYSWGPE
ncbi:hypothetical protein LCGC14_0142600 [marine sediment metagenome]|uniref:Uncharacterized protein n=1 Tax=marine sediment metagenome TaxID=412755 RepID=A0A0F9V198_9ZZZZ